MNPPAVPPRFVPTLTDVVHPGTAQESVRTASPAAGSQQREEQLVMRVMQRVDMIFERRLREAVGELILAQTEALAPRLRAEIQGVVRDSVRQALAQGEVPGPVGRD